MRQDTLLASAAISIAAITITACSSSSGANGMGGGMEHKHFELGMHTTFSVNTA